MIYPEFLKNNQTIGICAPSAGMGDNLDSFKDALKVLKNESFKIKESASVRNKGLRSTSAKKRAKELNELISNPKINAIMCATGGDFMVEILPYVDFENIVKNKKWIMGYSDPTNLLFPLTTKYDLATIYGFNTGYRLESKRYQRDNLKIIKGNLIKQNSYKKYNTFLESINDNEKIKHDVYWKAKKEIKTSGRIIGGCLDVIQFLIGTPYDGTNDFIERYKEDGIIWYFDIFSMSPENVYYTLLQLRNAGYFKYCKAILIGRIAFESKGFTGLTYDKAYKLALKDIDYISEMDIGHTKPHMTIINGAIAEIYCNEGKGYLKQSLK